MLPRPDTSRWPHRLLLVIALAAATLPRGADNPAPRVSNRMAALPRLVLWAWERPETLYGLDARRAAVAFLATTVRLTGDHDVFHRRAQPLRVDPATTCIAVVRIETDRRRPPMFRANRTAALARDIAWFARRPGVRGLQIDFDATRSERSFYRDLIVATRAALPAHLPLSITALASWCSYDNWLDDLPIDEAVPMLFRMGRFEADGYKRLGASGGWRAAACRGSVGISTDEPFALRRAGRRVYVFSPTAWTPDRATAVEREVQAWPE